MTAKILIAATVGEIARREVELSRGVDRHRELDLTGDHLERRGHRRR